MRLFIIIIFGLFSVKSLALEIICNPDEDVYFEMADIVFVGQVIHKKAVQEKSGGLCWTIENGERCGSKVATFNIEETLKGDVSSQTTVIAGDGCYCVSPYFDKGDRYIVFAQINGYRATYKSLNGCATQQFSTQKFNKLKKYKKMLKILSAK